ncbi:unnamed protein product [Lymnaea stagnalis]|uniref:Stn1 C-terminal domain-containing protein n=1 Tax=Lymnaea stagnalis TaxID=6523 RepID=A0AAV2I7K9_LYMST
MKEISVLDHRKIVNPNVELERLLRLPHLYAIYNKPFTPPTTVGKQLMITSSEKHSVNELTLKYTIRQLLKNPLPVPCEITPQDLLTWPGIISLLPPVQKGQRDTQELIRMMSSILQELEKTMGCVFQRNNKADTFEVMCPDCPLADLVKQLLSEACQNGKNAEMGCHILHIEHQVKRSPRYSRIHTAVLTYLFECLETNSDIITVGPQRYIPVS